MQIVIYGDKGFIEVNSNKEKGMVPDRLAYQEPGKKYVRKF